MFRRLIIGICVLGFSLQAFTAECLLSQALSNSKLSNNPDFWSEYSALMAKGRSSDEAINVLAKKYDPGFGGGTRAASTRPQSIPAGSFNLEIHRRARGEIARLPVQLKKKVDGFLEVAMKPGGIKELYANPGKWHFEKLAQFGPNAHSVRLNGGYRVLFDIKDDKLLVREVNKGHIHGD